MSISSEISRISGNVSDALTAIANKGVTVPSGSNSDDLANLIAQISGGGGTTWETLMDNDVTVTADNPNYFTYSPYTTPFQANETYRVTWGSGGTQYLCNTYSLPSGISYDGYGFGNTAFGGGSDTGEPFAIYRNNSSTLACLTTASAGIIHVKVEKQVSSGGATLITKSITQNGTYDAEDDDADGYSSVTVNVSGGSSTLITKTITVNGTYNAVSDNADGYSSVTVNVSGGSSVLTETGTFTGNGTNTQTISCSFAPDLIYLYGDLSGTASLRGIVSITIIKDIQLVVFADSSTSTYSEYLLYGVLKELIGYNESDTANPHASYSNNTLTIDTVYNSGTARFASGITYSYKLIKWS